MTTSVRQPVYLPHRQRGIALFISLVLLLVLTIAGVSAVQTTTMEERMARNSHDSLIAFQAAETMPKIHTIVIDTLTYLLDMYESLYVLNSTNGMKAWGDFAVPAATAGRASGRR